MGGTFGKPGSGLVLTPSPSIRDGGAQLRIPFVEQLATQLGGVIGHSSRPLWPQERAVAKPVFGESLDYDSVRVITSAVASAPTTLGSYVRVANDRQLDDATLVHELTHVWQFQTRGTGYISNSMCAQLSGMLRSGSRNAAYELRGEQLVNVRSIYDLSAERQARAVELYYVSTLLRDSDPMVQQDARQRFWYLVQDLTDPKQDAKQADAEHAALERLIAEVRSAQAVQALDRYIESMYGPGGSARAPGRFFPEQQVAPVLRIEF